MNGAPTNCKGCQLPIAVTQTVCPYCGISQNAGGMAGATWSGAKAFLIVLLFVTAALAGGWSIWRNPAILAELLNPANLLRTLCFATGTVASGIVLSGYQKPWRSIPSALLTAAGVALALIVAASFFEPHGQLLLDVDLQMVPLGTVAFFFGVLLWPLPRGTFLVKCLLLWGFAGVLIAKPYVNPMQWRAYDYATRQYGDWRALPIDSETHFYFILSGALLAFMTTTLALAALKKALTSPSRPV